ASLGDRLSLEGRDAAATLIRRLSPQERAAILLKDVFDFTIDETAGILTTTPGAIKAALHPGRAKLSRDPPFPPPPPALPPAPRAPPARAGGRRRAVLRRVHRGGPGSPRRAPPGPGARRHRRHRDGVRAGEDAAVRYRVAVSQPLHADWARRGGPVAPRRSRR